MGILELFLIGVGLSMDAFAVAVCKGLSLKKKNYKMAFITAVFFGSFQAIMPLIGYFLGRRFAEYITSFDHWIAFGLLTIVGINMIKESSCKVEAADDSFCIKNMLILSVSTSIDALAIGVTLSFLYVDIIPAVTIIGITTFVLSFFGVILGNVFGAKFKSKAEFAGGIILIGMGLKILLEHLYVIGA